MWAGLAYPACKLDTSPDAMGQFRLSPITALRCLSAAMLCLFAGTAIAMAACRVTPVATVPIDQVDGHILVNVQVNESEATFVLDTGADRTLMSEDVVRRLGLARDGWVASTVLGLGGYQQ